MHAMARVNSLKVCCSFPFPRFCVASDTKGLRIYVKGVEGTSWKERKFIKDDL